MKKLYSILAAALLTGAVFASASPSAEAASFDPILAKPVSSFPFTDVSAESKEMVSALYQNKFFNGISADMFEWNQTIKRVDAAVIAARGMGYRKDQRPLREETLTFTDIPERAQSARSPFFNFME
ncbi:S-layer homology domain-containing protein [Domibacillus robiginosus]|uniref:S-layer homology domain-containing protein n=1 Tax=Domibacillus robiginosus TaxID=1071054 RepID=UPI00067CC945|nr:S-layer homology domain-containing protein [Domibacillus robiginosus]